LEKTMTTIDEISKIVEAACAAETNSFGYDIWTHHITRVVENGRRLAPLLGADEDIVELGALLHDYAGIKDPAMRQDHHIHGQREAEQLLRGLGYPEDRIEAVKYCIANHRGSVPGDRGTPEADCLASADALAHLESVPALLYLAYTRRGMGIGEGAAWLRGKLERSWNKLSPPVKEIARDRYEAARLVLASQAIEEVER
jgi:uncharacterized protein